MNRTLRDAESLEEYAEEGAIKKVLRTTRPCAIRWYQRTEASLQRLFLLLMSKCQKRIRHTSNHPKVFEVLEKEMILRFSAPHICR